MNDVIEQSQFDPKLMKRAARVRMLVLDVDGVLTDGNLYFDNSGNEMKGFSTRDGFGMRCLQRHGIELALITGRKSQIVENRAQQLGIRHVYQGRNDKLRAFDELLGVTGFEANDVCYAGDDWIDLPVLDRVGFSVTVADADAVVKRRVHWVTSRPGGNGAVREICDLIMAATGIDKLMLDEILNL